MKDILNKDIIKKTKYTIYNLWDNHKYTAIIGLIVITPVIFILWLSYGNETNPASNIAKNLNLNPWDWLTLMIAFISLGVAVLTLFSQNETRKNTAIVSNKQLKDKFSGYYNSLIRNVVSLYPLQIKMNLNNWESYPSEDYMWKMKLSEIEENNISIKLVYEVYHRIQSFNELVRFYNYSVDATVLHLKKDYLSKDIRKKEIDNLISMIWFISSRLLENMDELFQYDKKSIRNIIGSSLYNSIENLHKDLIKDQTVPINFHSCFQEIKTNPFLNEIFMGDQRFPDFLNNLTAIISFRLSKDSITLIPFR